MQTITTIGLDIAKSVFQVHGVDAAGEVVIRRQLKRRYVLAFFEKLPPCLVGIEACASSHYWSRELQVLGHTVRLMPPAYVKPYVKRQKNDAADAEAICEAVTRANMRLVPTKTPEQQSCLMLHRTRHLFIRQQTAVINSIRAHLAEFGIVAPVGRKGVTELLHVVADPGDKRVPEVARACLAALGTQLLRLKEQIVEFDRMIMAWHRSNQTSKRLHYIPGVGPMLATALVASVADPRTFRSGRNFSAWIGLVPKQHSSGGKDRLGGISKLGDRYLRSLFVAGALAVIRYAKIHGTKHRPWLTASGSRFGRVPMCDKCDELDKKIEHCRRIRLSIGDQITIERIEALIGDLQAQKATLHPEQKAVGRLSWRPLSRRAPEYPSARRHA